ncbi:phage protease [Celeribacter sp.]|uniref:phage protease n=1 Tax=Celeribacter sp. TaxID=1890673 RepID=UPI003A8F1DAE
MVKNVAYLTPVALNFAVGEEVPEWVQLLPAAPHVIGRDGRRWHMFDPSVVVSRFDPAKLPQVDIEHSSELLAPQGMPAPAVGWIEALDVRDGAIWGKVSWTGVGRDYVASRAYRYLSPVFRHTQSGEIIEIASAGLTNNPNLEMAALNAAQYEENVMDPAILEALGLKPDSFCCRRRCGDQQPERQRAHCAQCCANP